MQWDGAGGEGEGGWRESNLAPIIESLSVLPRDLAHGIVSISGFLSRERETTATLRQFVIPRKPRKKVRSALPWLTQPNRNIPPEGRERKEKSRRTQRGGQKARRARTAPPPPPGCRGCLPLNREELDASETGISWKS